MDGPDEPMPKSANLNKRTVDLGFSDFLRENSAKILFASSFSPIRQQNFGFLSQGLPSFQTTPIDLSWFIHHLRVFQTFPVLYSVYPVSIISVASTRGRTEHTGLGLAHWTFFPPGRLLIRDEGCIIHTGVTCDVWRVTCVCAWIYIAHV